MKKILIPLLILVVVSVGAAWWYLKPQLNTSQLPKITMQEVSQRNTTDICWVVIDGKVYDFSGFGGKHKGGAGVIWSSCGKDATELFNNRDGKGPHSATSQMSLEDFLIGQL